jgi:hypothetical protein
MVKSFTLRYKLDIKMDDPWADTPSSTVIPPRPPKADRRSIPQPTRPEVEVIEVKADETKDEVAGFTDEPEEDVYGSPKPEPEEKGEGDGDGFDDFGQNGHGHQEPEGGDGEDGGFDDFDDFDAPAGPSAPGEDGFGDFGDFEEGDFETNEPTQEMQEETVPEVPTRQWVSQPEDKGMLMKVCIKSTTFS